ncbi:hypothetical protein JOC78_001667 [Bacillus ectoiniformans]|uniref:hypothetical protein n=1 Tax=Bacillus ectoiniformans TaxID=1494429 RepID=UPI00195610CC|nr:hypothetical protein [Bacillus ectoiniformans]MBM7648721.1 hypothetical protein [Bacillus ectoiniformans]
MNKKLTDISVVFLGICIVLSSWLISKSLAENNTQNDFIEQDRYEFLIPNDQNIIIFDRETGEYWRKFIAPNEGPTEWEKQESPITTK